MNDLLIPSIVVLLIMLNVYIFYKTFWPSMKKKLILINSVVFNDGEINEEKCITKKYFDKKMNEFKMKQN